jgi:hypothetical protein
LIPLSLWERARGEGNKKQVCLGIPVLIFTDIKKKRPSIFCKQLIEK